MDVTGKIAQARAASSVPNRTQMFDSTTGVQTGAMQTAVTPSQQNNDDLAELEKILDQAESYGGGVGAQKEILRPTTEAAVAPAETTTTEPKIENQPEIMEVAPETLLNKLESQAETSAKTAAAETAKEQSVEDQAEKEKIQELEQSLQAMAEKAKAERAEKPDQNSSQNKVQDTSVATKDNNVIITLPLSKSQEELAIKMPFNTSLRWLAELSKKLQKRFLGRTVYPEERRKEEEQKEGVSQ